MTDSDFARRHIRFGWWSLFFYAALGLVLESLHAFKVRPYLDVSNDTRRLMWTLAHAHGTLLSLVHLIYGLGLRVMPELSEGRTGLISRSLVGASLLLPGGFFLGGIVFYSGDPGLGVLLVPLGAALLLMGLFYLSLGATALPRSAPHPPRTKGDRKSN